MKALTDIRHDDKFFAAGSDVKGLDKETTQTLVDTGALGSEDDYRAATTNESDELTQLRARVAELEAQTEGKVDTGGTDVDTGVQDQVNATDTPAPEKGDK